MSPVRLPSEPEDFRVDEVPLYAPSGEGGHTFVRVEKRLRTTEQVARELARAAGVPPRDVGYAGRKDRMGITTQWLSVPALPPERALELALTDARVLEARRHGHKLRTGQLRANRFRLRVRDVDDATAARAERRLAGLVDTGLPNRFGPQRFGRDGDNPARALALLRGELRVRDRREARFLLSALQAEVFNAALALRETPLDRLEAGDVAVVHASGGLFAVEQPEAESQRARAFEISATGPIFGDRVVHKAPRPAHGVAERERRALAAVGVPLDAGPPPGVRLPGARRPLRVRPEAAQLSREGDALLVDVVLPSGSYATVLLDELFSALP